MIIPVVRSWLMRDRLPEKTDRWHLKVSLAIIFKNCCVSITVMPCNVQRLCCELSAARLPMPCLEGDTRARFADCASHRPARSTQCTPKPETPTKTHKQTPQQQVSSAGYIGRCPGVRFLYRLWRRSSRSLASLSLCPLSRRASSTNAKRLRQTPRRTPSSWLGPPLAAAFVYSGHFCRNESSHYLFFSPRAPYNANRPHDGTGRRYVQR